MNIIRVQTGDFDISAECDALVHGRPDIGAIVTFTGCVRGDESLIALTLEHYPGMTEREIAKHIAEAEAHWPILGATIIHRIGRLVPGERIVLVAVGSAHREAAFRAVEFLMDYLKTQAPFWKREQRGSEANWVEARESDANAALRWRQS
ncbi:MAG TPA: molybdenum cofactor biosynthesis protein MoaE [Rhizomicrobium sp.]|jgi:molybdopterin synthase catalytic subunit|nr:molybdenum cofactor biosynthesis protein MoaE [Rhizomicrobium sp.]